MQLSTHFATGEFEHGDKIPEDCIGVFGKLCTEILEPVREFVGKPIVVTSGYRTAASNKAAHGATRSEHMATDRYCAADFTFDTTFGLMMSVRRVFDWMRDNPSLPYHQVILEHGAGGQSIIHVSVNLDDLGTREALEGATHNAMAYTPWPVVEFNPGTESAGQENA